MPELFTEEEVRRHLRAECEEAGGQKAWAEKHGLSLAYVNAVLVRGQSIGDGIAKALGLRRVVMYEDAGKRALAGTEGA